MQVALLDRPANGRRTPVEATVRPTPGLAGAFLIVVVAQFAIAPYSIVAIKAAVAIVGAIALVRVPGAAASPLARLAAGWCVAAAAATAFGVDAWQSLLGREDQANGLLLIIVCAACLVGGSVLPRSVLARIPRWLIVTGVTVAFLTIVLAVVPEVLEPLQITLGFEGAGLPPLGHPVYSGALLAAALAAVTPYVARRPILGLAIIAGLSLGMAATGKRGAVLGAMGGFAVAALRARLPLAHSFAIAATVIVMFAAWSVSGSSAPGPVGEGARLSSIVNGSSMARPYVWSTSLRASAARPLTGWGPGSTWGATLASQTREEALMTGRAFRDAHNIVVENAVATGLLGTVAFLALLVGAARRALRAAPERAWALGAAVALGIHHALQPVHPSVTPLAFLVLGIAAGSSSSPAGTPSVPAALSARVGLIRNATIVLLTVGLVLMGMRTAAGSLEGYGRRFYTPGYPAVRAALVLEPRSLSAREFLLAQQAVDAAGDRAASARIRRAVVRMVREHDHEPASRIGAARVEFVLRDPRRAAAWLEEHLDMFPYDSVAMSLRANAAWRMGDDDGYRRWLARAREIEPNAGRPLFSS